MQSFIFCKRDDNHKLQILDEASAQQSDKGRTLTSSQGSTARWDTPGQAEKDAPMKALMVLEDDGLDDEIVFESAEGSQEPKE